MHSHLRLGRLAGAYHSALRVVFPPQCIACGTPVDSAGGLCGPCWRDTPLIGGLVCDLCGLPLPGEAMPDAAMVPCDDCLQRPRPWAQGRAALLYDGVGRKLVLALKHGDRQDLGGPLAGFMAPHAADVAGPDAIIAPVPIHWRRLLARRYNQSAVLALALARRTGRPVCPDLFRRPRATPTQEGRDPEARFANLAGAIAVTPRHRRRLAGAELLLVDDVLTSGATLAATAEAALEAGAARVAVVALARTARRG